jgi:hypothetical protein
MTVGTMPLFVKLSVSILNAPFYCHTGCLFAECRGSKFGKFSRQKYPATYHKNIVELELIQFCQMLVWFSK